MMYILGQDNKMHRCVTTKETQIIHKELDEGITTSHFATNITSKKILDVGY